MTEETNVMYKLFLEYENASKELEIIELSEEQQKALFVDNDNTEQTKKYLRSKYCKKDGKKIIINKEFFAEDKKVKDIHRYNLMYCRIRKWILTDHCGNSPVISVKGQKNSYDKAIKKLPEQNNILIILESPHDDEYTENFEPLSPANGKTNQYFLQYFTSHTLPLLHAFGLNLDKKKIYSICFVNPVPFQTSLVALINKNKKETPNAIKKLKKDIRNEVWKKLYSKCKNQFEEDIVSYQPVLILNGCTAEVKSEVAKSIDKVLNAKKFSVAHPSDWFHLGAFKPFLTQFSEGEKEKNE